MTLFSKAEHMLCLIAPDFLFNLTTAHDYIIWLPLSARRILLQLTLYWQVAFQDGWHLRALNITYEDNRVTSLD